MTTLHALKGHLSDWVDVDVAMAALGLVLGLYPAGEAPFHGVKWVFWTDNAACRLLHGMLGDLVVLGALEVSEDGERYRWRADFDLSVLG